LLLRIEDIMHTGERIPQVAPDVPLREALLEMSAKGLGMTAVTAPDGKLQGVFTDGDLRRCLDRGVDIHNTVVAEVMTPGGRTARPRQLAVEAVSMMEEYKINALPVVDDEGRLIGALNMHDLLRAGVVRSEEHTSELQSRENLVCRLLLEKKKHQQPNDQKHENSHTMHWNY